MNCITLGDLQMDDKAFDSQRIAEGYAKRPWLHKEVIEQIKKIVIFNS